MMTANLLELPAMDKGAQTEMVTTTMLVTPQQAQAWLDAMPIQRRTRQNKIQTLSRQVLEGRWRLSPHGIVIGKSGYIIDGQHRLIVCAQTGRPMQLRVTFNAPDESFLVIDGAVSPKTLDDALHHEGVARGLSVIVAGPVRMLFREERGASIWENSLQCSNEEGIEVFRRHPGLVTASELAAKVRLAPSRALLAYFVYRAMEVDETVTRLFVDALATGEQLRSGDPALLLRNTWIQERNSRVKATGLHDTIRIATAINAALRGKKLPSWRGVEFGKGKTPAIGR